MRQADIVIVGGGLAGSLTASMAARAGVDVVLIDPHRELPNDFRCEKFDDLQVAILEKTGLADAILPRLSLAWETWIVRYGHLAEKRRGEHYGTSYRNLVQAARDTIPGSVDFIKGKADKVETSKDRQRVTLHDGETIEARLVVLATGLNQGLRESLGIERRVLTRCFSTAVGFDLKPKGRASFDFPALSYFPEHPRDRLAYFSMFPIGDSMRANLFAYRDLKDPWMQELRHGTDETLFKLMPALRRFTGHFEMSDIRIRSVDLVVTENYERDGVVLIGDAFGTSCPAAGTGTNKVLTDAERLCNVYLPAWLATPGMGAEKIAAFYHDPVKRAADAYSAGRAKTVRALAIDTHLFWRLRRFARFVAQYGRGHLGRLRPAPAGMPLRDSTA